MFNRCGSGCVNGPCAHQPFSGNFCRVPFNWLALCGALRFIECCAISHLYSPRGETHVLNTLVKVQAAKQTGIICWTKQLRLLPIRQYRDSRSYCNFTAIYRKWNYKSCNKVIKLTFIAVWIWHPSAEYIKSIVLKENNVAITMKELHIMQS